GGGGRTAGGTLEKLQGHGQGIRSGQARRLSQQLRDQASVKVRVVMVEHSASKTRVNALMPDHPLLLFAAMKQAVDARTERGPDLTQTNALPGERRWQ